MIFLRGMVSKVKMKKQVLQIIKAGMEAVKTEKVIYENVKVKGDFLFVKNKKYNLNRRIYVVGFGKAAGAMALAIEKILPRIDGGIVISTEKIKLKRIKLIVGTHPFPSLENISASKEIVKLFQGLDKNDLIICLISGGGSSLLCYPSIDFEKYLKIIKKAFNSGISIEKLNKVRKKYSIVKDGRLAKMTKAKVVSLIFSDVLGDKINVIASGPTAARGVDNLILLNNKVALDAMMKKAKDLKLKPVILTSELKGEARTAGKRILKLIKKYPNKNCYLFAGETAVKVVGKGKGGRNQEFCLGAVEEVAKTGKCVLCSIGTDGIDGNTNAAGAIVDDKSFSLIKKKKINYKKHLLQNDSYNALKKINALIFTGKTGTNIADIGLVLKY